MKKQSGFRLNGKPLDMRWVPPLVTKAAAFLSKMPNDDLLDKDQLASRLSCSPGHLARCSKYEEMLSYRATIPSTGARTLVFGNAVTIKRLLKGLESA